MRLSVRNLQTVYLRKRLKDERDAEANRIIKWGDPIPLKMTVQSVGGAVEMVKYGEELKYVKSCKYQGNEIQDERNEGDGICLYVEPEKDPDYQITSVKKATFHKNVILGRRKKNGKSKD